MTKNVNGLQKYIGWGTEENRKKDDFYATPEYVIQALLDREKFEGKIWEPACGDGAISKCLKKNGYNVYSTDLVDRGFGDAHFDFMNCLNQTDNIVTNPPFNLGTKFTIHALNLATRKVAIFNKLSFLEGKERRDKLFARKHLKSVYVFSERVSFSTSNGNKGGMLAFAWFVFDKNYYGDSRIQFI